MPNKLVGFAIKKIRKFSGLLLLFLALILITSSVRSIVRIRRAGRELFEVEEEVEEIKLENQNLRLRLEEAQSDEYIEKQLRDKLGLAKEDEIVVILPAEEVVRKFAPMREEEEEFLPDPNWKKWVRLFY